MLGALEIGRTRPGSVVKERSCGDTNCDGDDKSSSGGDLERPGHSGYGVAERAAILGDGEVVERSSGGVVARAH